MDDHRHVSSRQKRAEKKRDVLQPADKRPVEGAGEVVVQGLEILHKQEGQQDGARGTLHQQSHTALCQFSAHHIRPLSEPHPGEHTSPLQKSGEIPRSQQRLQRALSHHPADLVQNSRSSGALQITQHHGSMALAARLQRLKFQGSALHTSADHRHIQLVGFGKSVLGAPLHHLVLRLLGTAIGKSLNAGHQPFPTAVHTQQHKAAHQQGEQLIHPPFPAQVRCAEHLAFNEIHHGFGLIRVSLCLQQRLQ